MKETGNKKNGKTNKPMIVAGIIWAICIILIVVFFLWKNVKTVQEPDKVMKKYTSYIEEKKYEKMYAMLSEESQKKISKENFVERNKNIYKGIEVKDLKLEIDEVIEQKKSKKTVTYSTTMNSTAGEITFDNQAVFLREKDRGYCLEWSDSLIFPNLEEQDKVRVNHIPAKRGSIVDRNGKLLAGEGTQSSVGVVPGKLGDNKEAGIATLATMLGLSVEYIQQKLEEAWVQPDSLVPLKMIERPEMLQVGVEQPSEETLRIQQFQADLLTIPGVLISDVTTRTYPFKEATSHLLGYVQSITAEELEEHKEEGYSSVSVIGKSGLEKLYEKELKGKEGCDIKIIGSNDVEKEVLATTVKEDGKEIKVTVDATIQQHLYNQFQEDKSCSVAMNPKTGEVLALVSTPTFNSNDFIAGMSDAKWNELNTNPNKPLWNRFRETWSPGSTFKSVVAALGLTTGTIDPQENYGNEGLSWQKDASWGDYFVTTLKAYDEVILANALMYSDNIYFAKSALKIGADTFTNELKKIGFGETIPFEIGMGTSSYSNGETIDAEIQLADSGYGQGQILTDPLHLASMYSSFVNDGSMIQPYVKYKDEKAPIFWKTQVFTKEATEMVKSAMIQVIENPGGTATNAQTPGVLLAGKTGTAEIKMSQEDTTGTELGWFAVFTADPAVENPVMIISMVEDVKELGGSTYVVNKDKAVMDQIFFGTN